MLWKSFWPASQSRGRDCERFANLFGCEHGMSVSTKRFVRVKTRLWAIKRLYNNSSDYERKSLNRSLFLKTLILINYFLGVFGIIWECFLEIKRNFRLRLEVSLGVLGVYKKKKPWAWGSRSLLGWAYCNTKISNNLKKSKVFRLFLLCTYKVW